MSLKEKTINGAKWVIIDNFLNIGISFFISIILARLLTPAYYGLIGMSAVFISILNVFVSSGLGKSLIRCRNVSQKDFSTVFYFNLVVCIVCYILLYIGAPLIADFYKEPVLKNIVRISGLSLIISGLSLVQNVIRIREINFKIQAKISTISNIIGGITGIILAFKGFGVWSIVCQTLTRSIMNTSQYWITSKWRPKWYFSKKIFFRHFSYGINILKSNLIISVVDNVYSLVIGRYYSPSLLGQYSRAESFINLPTKNIQLTANSVFFPVLCSINNNMERLRAVFNRLMAIISFVSAYLIFMFVAVSDNFIPFVIGPQWGIAIVYVKFLMIGAFLYPLKSQNIQLINVLGRSDIYVKAVSFQRTLTIITAIIGIFTSIWVLVCGYSVLGVCSYIYNAYQVKKVAGIDIGVQLKMILNCNWITFTLASIVYILGLSLNYGYCINFLIQFIMALVLSFVTFETIKPKVYLEVKNIILEEFKKLSKL